VRRRQQRSLLPKSLWRAGALLVSCVLAAVLGFQWHAEAHAATASSGSAVDPLQFGIWSSRPDSKVSIEVDADPAMGVDGEQYPADVEVTVNAAPGTKLIFTSPEKPRTTYTRSIPGPSRKLIYLLVDVPSPAPRQGVSIGMFDMPQADYAQGLSLVVRMPTIAAEGGPNFGKRYATAQNDPNRLYYDAPIGLVDNEDSPDAIKADPKEHPGTVFYGTAALTATETARGLGDLSGYTIDTAEPSNGVASNGSYTWTGSYGLSGTLVATPRNLVAEMSQFDFQSGIALGIAAALGVAFLQELPDEFRKRRRRAGTGNDGQPLDEKGWVMRD
jgi:hypothetical protein